MAQRLLLTDEQLWRAIAENTNKMSGLVDQQLELATTINTPDDIDRRTSRMQLNVQTISRLERQYQAFSAELRRRYS